MKLLYYAENSPNHILICFCKILYNEYNLHHFVILPLLFGMLYLHRFFQKERYVHILSKSYLIISTYLLSLFFT
nr:MAG TPA: hypothetical protein [Crassvirales sp.]